jgi:hypothetical protein
MAGIALALLLLVAFTAYVFLAVEISDDSCLGQPHLGQPQVGVQSTSVNVSAGSPGRWEFRYTRASIWIDGVRAGEIGPLSPGASAGPMGFQDLDGDQRLSVNDNFNVETSPSKAYRLELYYGSCPYPSSAHWTT